jgi:hypothetical protein
MRYFSLYRISAYLLMLGFLGHTLGGMLGTSRRAPEPGVPADEVFHAMKSVHFTWQGADHTWYASWMGNGLSVSALLLLAIVILWVLGGLDASQRQAFAPIAWATVGSLALLAVLGFAYFSPFVGMVFGLVALLAGIATVRS